MPSEVVSVYLEAGPDNPVAFRATETHADGSITFQIHYGPDALREAYPKLNIIRISGPVLASVDNRSKE